MYFTETTHFYNGHTPHALVAQFGSPLYVYNEALFRKNCRTLRNMCPYPHFQAHYSIKANSNLTLLRIAREEGLCGEATSPGEVAMLLAAGFPAADILVIANNASDQEMAYYTETGCILSLESLSQLDRYGRLFPGGRIVLRFNPGVGSGHHKNVVTGGENTKFGINAEAVPQVQALLATHRLQLLGINQHIGSGVLEPEKYMESLANTLEIARQFPGLQFIDLGGGFGIPYRKQEGEAPLDMAALGKTLAQYMADFAQQYGNPNLVFKVEPGRYIPAESGVLLATVWAKKQNGKQKFVGTDAGFSTLLRPVMYDAHHDIEVYPAGVPATETEVVNVVGNICETGDYLARARALPVTQEGDVLGIMDAGAYGYTMASQYNGRPRPAELLIKTDGTLQQIRRRETVADLLAGM